MKTAIITGASGEIGAAIAKRFAIEGYCLVLHYHKNKQKAEELAKQLQTRCIVVQADLTKEADAMFLIAQAEQTFGSIDVLVNNAGISQTKLLIDTTECDYMQIFDTNIKSAITMSRLACRNMIANQSGKIVNISSIWGEVGASCETLYSSSKAAMIGFSLALAKELGSANITVNVVSPGMIATQMNAHLNQEDLEQIKSETPLSRLGTPEDVANAVYFFASEQANFITGQVLSVGGGWCK